MQNETKTAITEAIRRAKRGDPTGMICHSKHVATDVEYRVKRALRRSPGVHQLVRVSVMPTMPAAYR